MLRSKIQASLFTSWKPEWSFYGSLWALYEYETCPLPALISLPPPGECRWIIPIWEEGRLRTEREQMFWLRSINERGFQFWIHPIYPLIKAPIFQGQFYKSCEDLNLLCKITCILKRLLKRTGYKSSHCRPPFLKITSFVSPWYKSDKLH